MFRYRTWQSRPIPNPASTVSTPSSFLWSPQNDINLYGGLWFDSNDPAAGAVSSWLSREGKSHNAIQSTGSAQPTKGNTGVVFDGGDSVARTAATNIGLYIRSATLPDGEGSVAGKGFTGTGICRVPNTNQFWVANHGQDLPADVTWTPSLVRISYVAGVITKLQEITLADKYVSIETVQGLAYDTSDDTLWFADTNNTKIRHIQTDGTVISGDEITPTWAPNGLAYDATNDKLWIGEETSIGVNIESRSCATGAVVNAAIGTSLTNIDCLFYDDTTKCLLLTYGANGVAGNIQVYNTSGASGALVASGTIAMPAQVDAIEGVVWEGDTLYICNDGYFHSGASDLNEIIEVKVVPPASTKLSIHGTFIITATTGTDCVLEIGAPLSGNGFGIYPTSTTGMNIIFNSGASGTTQQATITATGHAALTSARLVDIYADTDANTGTLWIDGTQVQTSADMADVVNTFITGQTLRIGTASDIRPITGTIKDLIFVTGQSDRVRMEGYRAHRWGLTGNLPSNHAYKSVPPT
jgi:hypothetical protein